MGELFQLRQGLFVEVKRVNNDHIVESAVQNFAAQRHSELAEAVIGRQGAENVIYVTTRHWSSLDPRDGVSSALLSSR